MRTIMPIDHIPDWQSRLDRQDAFWRNAVLDRPVCVMTVHQPNADYPYPEAGPWKQPRDRWFDTEYHARMARACVMNTAYLGDALPYAFPNLGPEVFSAFMGQELDFGDATSWSIPCIHDWSDADAMVFRPDNVYFQQIMAMTDAMLEAGRGVFYTGITDLHPGADAIAAFRDPAEMNVDMLESPDEIRTLLDRVNRTYFDVYDRFYNHLCSAAQAITSWPGIVSRVKWYVPSNDFSCMISKRMFDEFFLPGIQLECQHMEANIYHLDGPQALQHLDSLLSIRELNAIQWVCGAGNGRATDWMPVYERIQAAGKGMQVGLMPDELDLFMERIAPEGVWLSVSVGSVDEAQAVLARVSRWTAKGKY